MTDTVTARLIVVQYEAELEMARYDEVQRLEFLRGLLAGTTSPAELHSRASAYGLVFDQPYYAVRARPADPRDREALKRAIEASGRLHGLPALVGVIEGEVAAVTPQRPDLGGLAATAGLGGPASLEAVEHAYHSASRMLAVALQFGATGVYGLDDLSLKVAVASEPELGSLLMRQYLDPLAGEGEFGELLEETVREFLANGQRILETSKRLGIHANTLRYRLDRFEKLTGTQPVPAPGRRRAVVGARVPHHGAPVPPPGLGGPATGGQIVRSTNGAGTPAGQTSVERSSAPIHDGSSLAGKPTTPPARETGRDSTR